MEKVTILYNASINLKKILFLSQGVEKKGNWSILPLNLNGHWLVRYLYASVAATAFIPLAHLF